jgi:glycosyltransferase involved in cell wall biosynthesis
MDIQKYAEFGLLKKLILHFLKKASYINVPGSQSKKFWNDLGIDADKINILHSTIDTENTFQPIEVEKEYDFIFVGELVARKQLNVVIDAINRIIKSGHAAKLAIIGEGPSKFELIQQAQNLNISDNIKFLGHQTDINFFLNKSKIFVLISKNEGIPCALMEAMACELLSVAINIGDVSDVLIDGETGFIVNENTVDSVYHVLKRAYLSYENSNAISKKARQKIIEDHSYPSATIKWDILLEKILNSQK